MNELIIKEIHFNNGDLQLHDYEQLDWKLKETRIVEFFPKVFYPVTLISTEIPDFENYLNDLANPNQIGSGGQFDNSKIAIDLEWEEELCLFQFCSSNKVLIIRHPNGPGNEILQRFLSSHSFFAKGASNDKKQLKLKFGEDFHQNIEDIAQTRLVPYGYSENFMQMTYQFAGKPTADFKDIRITTSNWSQKTLTMRQVLYAAFDVVAIYQCYPNFPPPKVLSKTQKQQKMKKQPKNIKKKQKNLNNSCHNKKKLNPNEKNKEKIKITMKTNYVRSTFCYMVTNYIGSILKTDLIYLLASIVDIDNINFISSYPESDQKSRNREIKKQIEENFKDEKYKEIANTVVDKINENKLHVANPKNTNSFLVFISLFNDIDIQKLIEIFPKSSHISKLPFIVPYESSDGDFLYITNIPENLSEKSHLEKFLHCFEIDHRLKIFENKTQDCSKIKKIEDNKDDDDQIAFLYARIEVCCASSSHNLKCFVPFITINGVNMKLFTFPFFLNSILASNFPPSFSEDDCRRIFSDFGHIDSIKTLIRRSDEDNNQFIITYNYLNDNNASSFDISNDIGYMDRNRDSGISNTINLSIESSKSGSTPNDDPCEVAIKSFNYAKIEGNEILVSRFAEEHHTRTMRRYEIAVSLKEVYLQQHHNSDNEFISSRKLRSIFSKFGEIHQAYFDKRLLVGHVQFYKKSSAFNAIKYFNCKDDNLTIENIKKKVENYDQSVDFSTLSKFDIFFPPEGATIIVRDISCSMPQEDIIRMCEMYGRVINFVVRLIIPKFRYQIVEVSYNDITEAAKAKKELDNKRIDNLPIIVSVFRGAGCEVPMWKMEERYQWIVVDGISIDETEARKSFEQFGTIIDFEVISRKRKNEKSLKEKKIEGIEKKEEEKIKNDNDNENEYEVSKIKLKDKQSLLRFGLEIDSENDSTDLVTSEQKTFIMFNDSRSAEAAIEAFTNLQNFNNDNDYTELDQNSLNFDIRFPTLQEFAYNVRWNRIAFQTEVYVPFKNLINEAQQLAIVIDPVPPGFSQQWLHKQCPKCIYTLAVTRSSVNPSNGRKAILFVDGMKMTKKIYALIRHQKCDIKTEEEEKKEIINKESVDTSSNYSADENDEESLDDQDNDDLLINPVIMSREEAIRGGVVINAEGNDIVHSPISIIIDPLPEELSTVKKIQTNILMGKEADIDIFESASEKGKLMGVILPRFKEDCKIILRKFRRWRVDGVPLNVKKIINNDDDDDSST